MNYMNCWKHSPSTIMHPWHLIKKLALIRQSSFTEIETISLLIFCFSSSIVWGLFLYTHFITAHKYYWPWNLKYPQCGMCTYPVSLYDCRASSSWIEKQQSSPSWSLSKTLGFSLLTSLPNPKTIWLWAVKMQTRCKVIKW